MAEKKQNPLDAKNTKQANNSALVQNIVSNETGKAQANILEAAPELDQTLLQEVAPPKSVLLLVLKWLCGILVVAGIFAVLFFTSQLTNKLNFATSALNIPSVYQDLENYNEEVKTVQTTGNFYRMLLVKSYLDEFSYYGDSYIEHFKTFNSKNASASAKKKAEDQLAALNPKLKEAFIAARDKMENLSVPIFDVEADKVQDLATLETLFGTLLRTELNGKAAVSEGFDDPEALRDKKVYLQTARLVGNQNLRNLLVQEDFDALDEQGVYDLIGKINNLVVNDLSIIQEVKEGRVKWSDIIAEIDLRTIAVDQYYNDQFFDEVGGIRYTSYDFDAVEGKISITGETKRFDNANFTMISNLIDELNRSEVFGEAEMNNFSKSGSVEDGYSAVLKLTLKLKTDNEE